MSRYNESKSQQALMQWWRMSHRGLGINHEELLMAFPLQGARSPQNGARMKAEGMRKGTPDLLLAVVRGGFGGLFIEMKTLDGRVSEDQKAMLARLIGSGYWCVVARGWEAASREIEAYLKGAKL